MTDVWSTPSIGGESMSPSCRPHSSIIATTSIYELPPTCVAKAAALLRGQPDALESFLAQPHCARALWLQGLEKSDVLSTAGNASGVKPASPRNVPGQSPRTRYAMQLLGQVIWEAELCTGTPMKQTEGCDRTSPRHFNRSRGEHSSSPEVRTCIDGSCGRPRTRPRPQSAHVRTTEAPEDIGDLRRWEAKLSFAVYLKAQHHKEVKERARSRNSRIEAVRATGAQMKQEHADRQQSQWQCRSKGHEERIARSKGAKQEISELMTNAAAVRQAVLETNRRKIFLQQEELRSQRIEQESRRQSEAEQKRRALLQEKGVGRAKLRATREISHKQALRLERIRCVERETLRQKLENKSPSATPSVSPRARSRPSSARISQPQPLRIPHPPFSKAPAARRPVVHGYKPDSSGCDWEPLVDKVPEPSLMPWPRCADAVVQDESTQRRRPSSAHGVDWCAGRTRPAPEPSGTAAASGDVLGAEGLFPMLGFRKVPTDDVLEEQLAAAAKSFHDDLGPWAADRPGIEPEDAGPAVAVMKLAPHVVPIEFMEDGQQRNEELNSDQAVTIVAEADADGLAENTGTGQRTYMESLDRDPHAVSAAAADLAADQPGVEAATDQARINHAVRLFVYEKLAHEPSQWQCLDSWDAPAQGTAEDTSKQALSTEAVEITSGQIPLADGTPVAWGVTESKSVQETEGKSSPSHNSQVRFDEGSHKSMDIPEVDVMTAGMAAVNSKRVPPGSETSSQSSCSRSS